VSEENHQAMLEENHGIWGAV